MNNLILFILIANFVLLVILLLQMLKINQSIPRPAQVNSKRIRSHIDSRVTCSTARGFAEDYKTFMQQSGANLNNEKASFKIERNDLENLLKDNDAKNYIGVFGRTANSNCLILLPADNNMNRIPYKDANGNSTPDVEEMFPEHLKLSNVDYNTLFNCDMTVKN